MQGELRVGEKEGQCIQWNGTLQGHPKSEAPIELAIKLVHLEPPRKGTTSELQIADTAGCPEQCFTAQKKTIGHTHKTTPISQDDSHTHSLLEAGGRYLTPSPSLHRSRQHQHRMPTA
jgi:hypothetical protein